MQHYLNYGYGFVSSKITMHEFEKALEISEQDRTLDDVYLKTGFKFVSYTEDNPEYDWSTAVLYSIGEIQNAGKAISLSEFNKISKKYGVISDNLKAEFIEVLTKVGLQHMIDKVELVIYSDNY